MGICSAKPYRPDSSSNLVNDRQLPREIELNRQISESNEMTDPRSLLSRQLVIEADRKVSQNNIVNDDDMVLQSRGFSSRRGSSDVNKSHDDLDDLEDAEAFISEIDRLLSDSSEMITPSPYKWQREAEYSSKYPHLTCIDDEYEINKISPNESNSGDMIRDNLLHRRDEVSDN